MTQRYKEGDIVFIKKVEGEDWEEGSGTVIEHSENGTVTLYDDTLEDKSDDGLRDCPDDILELVPKYKTVRREPGCYELFFDIYLLPNGKKIIILGGQEGGHQTIDTEKFFLDKDEDVDERIEKIVTEFKEIES